MNADATVQAEIWEVAALLAQPPAAPESRFRSDELTKCFDVLQVADVSERAAIEAKIWEVWCDHPDPAAKAEMAQGIRLLADGHLEDAESVFDALVALDALWAEAWNKRATIYFLRGRDAASVSDIRRTLILEPRHFGALGGFAQICMRNATPDAALAALERLLVIDPRVPGIARATKVLEHQVSKTLH